MLRDLECKRDVAQQLIESIETLIAVPGSVSPAPTRKRGPSRDLVREQIIIEALKSGRYMSDIAREVGLTRERIRQIRNRSVAEMSEPEAAAMFSKRSAPPEKKIEIRYAISRYLRHKSVIVYLDVCAACGITPLVDGVVAEMMPELAACREFYVRYGVKDFGKYIRCAYCDEIKAREHFSPAIRDSDATAKNNRCCRSCNTARGRAQYMLSPQKRAYARAYQRAHPEYAKAYYERVKATNPELLRARSSAAWSRRKGRIKEAALKILEAKRA